MAAERRGVLVTRPEPGASETAQRLAARDLCPVLAPVLGVTHRDVPPVPGAQAVLVTSGNAFPGLSRLDRSLPVLAVGDATAGRAREAGFATVHSAGRDAEALAALASAVLDPVRGPVLLASGAGQGAPLAADLRTRGFVVTHCVAYAAAPVERLPDAAVAAIAGGKLTAATFFSGETARVFVRLANKPPMADALRDVVAAAISRDAEAALAHLPWRDIRVASHPNQDELLALIP